MTPINFNSIAALSPSSMATSASASAGTPTTQENLGTQDVFLQLLVTQLKNQDPSQPTDGTAFVTQLAQFSTLQENTAATTDLNKIVAALPSLEAAGTTKTGN